MTTSRAKSTLPVVNILKDPLDSTKPVYGPACDALEALVLKGKVKVRRPLTGPLEVTQGTGVTDEDWQCLVSTGFLS